MVTIISHPVSTTDMAEERLNFMDTMLWFILGGACI